MVRRNQVDLLVYGQDSKKIGRSVGKVKIILLDFKGQFFFLMIFCILNTKEKPTIYNLL